MPCYLGEYENCASNRETKFIRAVNSFINQNYDEKELIIVSDGCDNTIKVYNLLFKNEKNIFCYKIKKQPLFSGNVRDYGIKKSTGDIICYLDADDFLGDSHIKTIAQNFNFKNNFKEIDWIYFNDYVKVSASDEIMRNSDLKLGSIGTSCIAHKNIKTKNPFKKKISWKGFNKYNHDWFFIQNLINNFKRFKKIYGCSYYVCHIPNLIDF